MNLLALDLGTTTIAGVLWDATGGQVLGHARRPNDAALPGLPATRAEQDPHRLRALALQVLAELAATGEVVDGIALTGQMHGLLCVDAAGEPLTPLISWQDRRTAETGTLDELRARVSDLDWGANGCRIHHGYGTATLFWLVEQGALPAGSERACTLAGWLGGQLSGQLPATDPTFAASWGLYDLVQATWNAAFVERLGLPQGLLPAVQPSSERLGGLSPGLARSTGLPAGLPILNGIGDTQASFLGSTAGDAEGASILVNLGTGGQVCWALPASIHSTGAALPSEAVETRPLLPGRILRVAASLCGGAAYAWLNRTVRAWLAEFGLEPDEEAVYARLNDLAACSERQHGTARSGTAGLRVRPTFLGVRGDPAVVDGAIEGIGLDGMDLGALALATLTGVVDELRDLYRAHAAPGTDHTRVVAAGGAVEQNSLLPGLIARRFELPVAVSGLKEAAAIGAATLAAGH